MRAEWNATTRTRTRGGGEGVSPSDGRGVMRPDTLIDMYVRLYLAGIAKRKKILCLYRDRFRRIAANSQQ